MTVSAGGAFPGDGGKGAIEAIDVRVGPLMPLAGLLREAGLDAAHLLMRHGLPAEFFDDPLRRVDFHSTGAFLCDCATALERPDLGLLIGQRFEFTSLGLLAPLMLCSRTVGAALDSLQRYFHLHDRGGVPFVRTMGDGQAALGYTLFSHSTAGAAIVLDMSMAVACRMMRSLCGAEWKAIEALLSRPEPTRRAPYRRIFAAPLRFDAAQTELIFDAQWLSQPVAGADTALLAAARRAAEAQGDARDRRVARRTRAVVQALIMTGRVSAGRVAQVLGVHERTLRRQLRDEGISLHAIVSAVREELARQLLRDTQLPIQEIAQALKYAHAAAFSRAFHAWSSTTPGEWREQARHATTESAAQDR